MEVAGSFHLRRLASLVPRRHEIPADRRSDGRNHRRGPAVAGRRCAFAPARSRSRCRSRAIPGARDVAPEVFRERGSGWDDALHVSGPQAPADVAPDSNLTLAGPNGWVNFQIAEVHAAASPPVRRGARDASSSSAAMLARIKVGDIDTSTARAALGHAARIVSLDGVAAASAGARRAHRARR